MPHKTNNRGSLILKRNFRGVSPIRRATGTHDTAVVEQIDLMLHALYNQGRLDLLESIARGRLHPLKALAQWRQGRELVLPSAELLVPLTEAWTKWESEVPGDDHRSSIGTTRRALNIPAHATTEHLPDLLASFMARNKSKVRTVNLARSHVSAFLRDTVGRSHALYKAVADLRPLKRKKRERGTPHDIADIIELQAKLNALLPGAGDMMWTMASTSMGNKEYWTDGFDVHRDRVQIYGQKREGRTREVPMWSAPLVKPICWEGRFRTLLRDASEKRVMVYDLRRSFRRWCEEAGIIESNIDAYMGHGPKSMGQLYSFGELPRQFAQDAAKLKAYRETKISLAAEHSA